MNLSFWPPCLLGTARPVPNRATDPLGVVPDTELLEVRYAATKKADDSGWETPAWFSEDKPVKHATPHRGQRERILDQHQSSFVAVLQWVVSLPGVSVPFEPLVAAFG